MDLEIIRLAAFAIGTLCCIVAVVITNSTLGAFLVMPLTLMGYNMCSDIQDRKKLIALINKSST